MIIKIDLSKISLRDLAVSDLPKVLDYWFHSPPGFLQAMGVDLNKMPTEKEMENKIIDNIQTNSQLEISQLNALAILYGDEFIGLHTIFPLVVGDHGIFHAHIVNPKFRGQGVGSVSYPRGCHVFMQRFNLNRILFKTPMQNTSAQRVKEKLGIRYLRDEVIDFGPIKAGTKARVYEITPPEAQEMACQVQKRL